jgi:hypothetical protein
LLAVFTQTLSGPPPGAVAGAAGAVVVVLAGGAAGGAVVVAEAPHVCTPPWPLQAPLRDVPLKLVPSLQVAVTGVWAVADTAKPTVKARARHSDFISLVSKPMNCVSRPEAYHAHIIRQT